MSIQAQKLTERRLSRTACRRPSVRLAFPEFDCFGGLSNRHLPASGGQIGAKFRNRNQNLILSALYAYPYSITGNCAYGNDFESRLKPSAQTAHYFFIWGVGVVWLDGYMGFEPRMA